MKMEIDTNPYLEHPNMQILGMGWFLVKNVVSSFQTKASSRLKNAILCFPCCGEQPVLIPQRTRHGVFEGLAWATNFNSTEKMHQVINVNSQSLPRT
jgi:hypothetical protein